MLVGEDFGLFATGIRTKNLPISFAIIQFFHCLSVHMLQLENAEWIVIKCHIF